MFHKKSWISVRLSHTWITAQNWSPCLENSSHWEWHGTEELSGQNQSATPPTQEHHSDFCVCLGDVDKPDTNLWISRPGPDSTEFSQLSTGSTKAQLLLIISWFEEEMGQLCCSRFPESKRKCHLTDRLTLLLQRLITQESTGYKLSKTQLTVDEP